MKDQYPTMGWEFTGTGWSGAWMSASTAQNVETLKATIPDAYGGSNRGLVVTLQINKLKVTAYTHTRSANKVRSVELQDPKSIDGLKELIDHVLKVCTLPPMFGR